MEINFVSKKSCITCFLGMFRSVVPLGRLSRLQQIRSLNLQEYQSKELLAKYVFFLFYRRFFVLTFTKLEILESIWIICVNDWRIFRHGCSVQNFIVAINKGDAAEKLRNFGQFYLSTFSINIFRRCRICGQSPNSGRRTWKRAFYKRKKGSWRSLYNQEVGLFFYIFDTFTVQFLLNKVL